jgi:hypothetical protein
MVSNGVMVTFPGMKRLVYYKLNKDSYNSLKQILSDVGRHRHTSQVVSTVFDERTIPQFGNQTNFDLNGIYSNNNWEIIAGTYKCKVESFLKQALSLGYNFQSPVMVHESDGKENNREDSVKIPCGFGIHTPAQRTSRTVAELVSGKSSANNLLMSRNRHYSFLTKEDPAKVTFDLDKRVEVDPMIASPSPIPNKGRMQTGGAPDLPSELENPFAPNIHVTPSRFCGGIMWNYKSQIPLFKGNPLPLQSIPMNYYMGPPVGIPSMKEWVIFKGCSRCPDMPQLNLAD